LYKQLCVTVVVPAYNEALLVGRTLRGIPDFVDSVVVIDDASTDNTSAAVLTVDDPRIHLIRHETNTGVGGAICDGHRWALEKGADVCVVMNGDDQMDARLLPALLDPIADDGVGFTKANRFGHLSALSAMPVMRLLGNVALSFMTKLASGYWNLFDPQNGYTAVRRSALERIDLSRLHRGFAFENDLLITLNILGVRARDVPMPAIYGDEVSSLRIHREAPRLAALLFRGFWRRMVLKYVFPSFSAIALLFFTGLALCPFGLVVGAYAVADSIGPKAATAGTVLLAVAPMLTGIHLLVQALVLDMSEGAR
jgi:glycosyltransferase involved in cell wall biosynthesis